MASRLMRKIMGLNHGHVFVSGSFAVNGSSAIDAASNKGVGWSVAYTSTGLYTVTFADLYPIFISGTAMLQLATKSDKFLQFGTYTASTGVLQIRCWDVSSTDLVDAGAADANNRIHFSCQFSNLSFT